MNYEKLYDEFLTYFPNDIIALNRITDKLSIDDSDGMHVVFGMVVVPFVLELASEKNSEKLKKAFSFFEQMAKSDNPLICEVLEFTILESIISQDKDILQYCKSYMGNETLECCQAVEQYMM